MPLPASSPMRCFFTGTKGTRPKAFPTTQPSVDRSSIEALAEVMVMKGVPEHLRSHNGPEFVARDLRKWLAGTGARTAYIEPGSPWENGYCESFNSNVRRGNHWVCGAML
jgi:transposase InsO family protein